MRDLVRVDISFGAAFALVACGGTPFGMAPSGHGDDGGAGASEGGSERSDASAPQVVFTTLTRGGGAPGPDNVYEVAVMNLDGSGRRQLTDDGKQKFLAHFSPDATKVVYTKFSAGGYGDPNAKADIALYDLATEKETMLTGDGRSTQATWSPHGDRIAYLGQASVAGAAVQGGAIWTIDPLGANAKKVASPSGDDDDLFWGDIAWSSRDWILLVVGQRTNGCFKARIDKIQPDGSARTKVTDGGPDCTPEGSPSPTGDADPGWSADGRTIFTSRGLGPHAVRHLFAVSSEAWTPGKPETDLYSAADGECGALTPKGAPDGNRILLVRGCPDSRPKGIYLTDDAVSYWAYLGEGFGPDWNPLNLP
jgi:hypothetical protein